MLNFLHRQFLTRALCAAMAFQLANPTLAQRFEPSPFSLDYPNLSSGCKEALNATVSCHPILLQAASQLPRLNLNDLNAVCTTTCLNTLQSVRTQIVAACTISDYVTVQKNKYPASYMVDYLIYAYIMMCRRDPTTQQYCDVLIMQWLNTGTADKACTDCALGAARMRLNSPFGYDKNGAARFSTITSSCSKTNHPLTSPAPYALNTATTSASATVPTYPASCVTLYTASAGDTCNSIAELRNVSSFAVYGANGVKDCSNVPAGMQLCLLGQCRRYKVLAGDTCQSILATSQLSIDAEVFTAFNPNIHADCMNIHKLVGQWICLSLSTGLVIPTLSTDNSNNTAIAWPFQSTTTSIVTPLPTAPGTLSGCLELRNYQVIPPVQDQYYVPSEEKVTNILNSCGYIINLMEISMELFKKWNPSLNSSTGCRLTPGLSYCVRHPDVSLPSSSTRSSSSSTSTTGGSSSSTVRSTTSSRSVSTTTTSSAITTTNTSTSVCISGTGSNNYAGLCSYSCHYGYCPAGVCTCSTYGQQIPPPPVTHPMGYPAPGLDNSYSGLCAFTCLRGYCPSGACTYTAP